MQMTTVLLELWRVSRFAGARLDEVLVDAPLAASDFGLYSVLRYRGPLTPTALARYAGTPATTTSQVLRRIEARGHLERRANPDDARSQLVVLTQAGQDAHEQAAVAFRPVLQGLEASLGPDLPAVVWALGRLEQALRAHSAGFNAERRDDARSTDAAPRAVHYTGAALSTVDRREVEQFIRWVQHRRAS